MGGATDVGDACEVAVVRENERPTRRQSGREADQTVVDRVMSEAASGDEVPNGQVPRRHDLTETART